MDHVNKKARREYFAAQEEQGVKHVVEEHCTNMDCAMIAEWNSDLLPNRVFPSTYYVDRLLENYGKSLYSHDFSGNDARLEYMKSTADRIQCSDQKKTLLSYIQRFEETMHSLPDRLKNHDQFFLFF